MTNLEREAARLSGAGGDDIDNPDRIVTLDRTSERRARSRLVLRSLGCPLPADPPWAEGALRGDVRMLIATRRARFPTCGRLVEGERGEVSCGRCLRSIVPWAARAAAYA